jgi:hypothetical protein
VSEGQDEERRCASADHARAKGLQFDCSDDCTLEIVPHGFEQRDVNRDGRAILSVGDVERVLDLRGLLLGGAVRGIDCSSLF